MNTKTNGPRFSLFDELDRGLNHLMNEVLQHDGRSSSGPALTVYEFDDRYEIECDVPGVPLENISLQIEDGVLQISGNRTRPYADDVKVTVDERKFAEFNRKLQLGGEVNADGVDAELGNGVLRVTVPKKAERLPKAINIRQGGSQPTENG